MQRAARSVPSLVPKMLRLLPFHRPASPDEKLSPSATIAVVDDAGPAWAVGAAANVTAASASAKAKTFDLVIRAPSPLFLPGRPTRAPRAATLTDTRDQIKGESPEAASIFRLP